MSRETNGPNEVLGAMQGILCEGCGYSLATILNSDRCPECGKPMAASMPSRRVGTAWQRKGWWAGLKDFLRRPVSTLKVARPWEPRGEVVELKSLSLAAALYSSSLTFTASMFASSDNLDEVTSLLSIVFLLCFALSFVGLLLACTFERWGLRRLAGFHGWRLGRAQSRTLSTHASFAWPLGMTVGLTASLLAWTGLFIPKGGYEGTQLLLSLGLGPALGLIGYEAVSYFGLRQNRYANW
jgi:hypothetical protein